MPYVLSPHTCPFLTLHRIHVKFQGSETTWPVPPQLQRDGEILYFCPHPKICGHTWGYTSASGLHRHTRAHLPDPTMRLPMFSLEALGTMGLSQTPPPLSQTV